MFEIVPGQYISVTPYGAFYAAGEERQDPLRSALFALMAHESNPLLTEAAACQWCDCADGAVALDTLFRLQSMAMAQGLEHPGAAPTGPLEDVLPQILPDLSEQKRALLADANGFYLGCAGFRHESAEELAALSADVMTLNSRHGRLLHANLGVGSSAWALVDAGGASEVGIWPIHVRGHRFALVVSGRPRFHEESFLTLVWMLTRRYGV